ncbi:MAG: hypothetical protein M0O96_11345 [Desulforhopalus sp.]|nr:hypothetical protein [Desulforhopalus sp.]
MTCAVEIEEAAVFHKDKFLQNFAAWRLLVDPIENPLHQGLIGKTAYAISDHEMGLLYLCYVFIYQKRVTGILYRKHGKASHR